MRNNEIFDLIDMKANETEKVEQLAECMLYLEKGDVVCFNHGTNQFFNVSKGVCYFRPVIAFSELKKKIISRNMWAMVDYQTLALEIIRKLKI